MRRLALRAVGAGAACAGAALLAAGGCCWVVYELCERGAGTAPPE